MSTIKTETLSTPSNSTVPVDTVVNGTAKAWVNFNGTGTVAIRRAFNVSSITDNGTGNYTITINSDMSNVNYSCSDSVGDHNDTSESVAFSYLHTQATGSVGIFSAHYDGGAFSDRSNLSVQICGDLA